MKLYFIKMALIISTCIFCLQSQAFCPIPGTIKYSKVNSRYEGYDQNNQVWIWVTSDRSLTDTPVFTGAHTINEQGSLTTTWMKCYYQFPSTGETFTLVPAVQTNFNLITSSPVSNWFGEDYIEGAEYWTCDDYTLPYSTKMCPFVNA